jgi:hypothetical protein
MADYYCSKHGDTEKDPYCLTVSRNDQKSPKPRLNKIAQSKSPGYSQISASQETSAVMRIKNNYPESRINRHTGNVEITENNVRIIINQYSELVTGMRGSTRQLFLALNMKYTEGNKENELVVMPIREYMLIRGLKDYKSVRKQVEEDLKVLSRIQLEWKEYKNKGKNKRDYLNIRISGGTEGILNGVIVFRFNKDFLLILQSCKIMPIPNEILMINSKRNPHSISLLIKLAEHANMNFGKSNANIIGVNSLLSYCSHLSSYEEVMANGRQVTKRIIDPFERDMDSITSISWEYCGAKGFPINPPTRYKDFIKAKVKFTFKDYPEREKIPPKKRSSKKKANCKHYKGGG